MRQTAADIDHAILDVAAGIFATHGFDHASVQQIADAVGYSKPGLLHRFGSKEALHQAVLGEVSGTLQAVLAHADAHQDHPERVAPVLEVLTRKALARPGMAQMMVRALESDGDEPRVEGISGMGERLVEALELTLDTPAERLRAVLAIKLVVAAAAYQDRSAGAALLVDPAELVPMVVSMAADVLGARERLPG